jgi:ubiquinol-cytochrome c reductase cytochrome c1 subunit
MIEALQRMKPPGFLVLVASAALMGPVLAIAAEEAAAAKEHAVEAAHGEGEGVDWQAWRAGNEVGDTASLQRGAANFVNYCLGCHSLKYMRYSRMATDLEITTPQLVANLVPNGAKPTDYIVSSFPAAEAEAWFGKVPPDLSLITRSRGKDYVYRFLKGFYVDHAKPTGSNNLALDGAAMPAVLSDLEGVKSAVFAKGEAGEEGKRLERFEVVSPGRLSPAQYDGFVRDTVNFLDYAGDPSQVRRRDIGIWGVLFLLVFTGFAWFLKKEYWKDVH